jgi:hypothetical protein
MRRQGMSDSAELMGMNSFWVGLARVLRFLGVVRQALLP